MRQGKVSELIHNSSTTAATPSKRKKSPGKGKAKKADDDEESDYESEEGADARQEFNSCSVEVHFREIVDLVGAERPIVSLGISLILSIHSRAPMRSPLYQGRNSSLHELHTEATSPSTPSTARPLL